MDHRGIFLLAINRGISRSDCSFDSVMDQKVPQGSVLVPILFLLFVNVLTVKLNRAKTFLYADNMSMDLSHVNRGDLEVLCFLEGNGHLRTMKGNAFRVNSLKTSLMGFSLGKRKENSQILILNGDEVVTFSDETKCLGLFLNTKLSFNSKIDKMSKDVSKGIYILWNLPQ